MAKTYKQITNDHRIWFERDDDSCTAPLRFIFHSEHGPVRSADLTDFELTDLAVFLQWLLLDRRGKLVLCNRPDLLERYEKELVAARGEHEMWKASCGPAPSEAREDEEALFG
ncbi:MAG TPA: hypothetical protein VMJ73_12155 [Rhizomicrobium sp.]|nr:hypothetical protein [Rhizomicrobium sp.]